MNKNKKGITTLEIVIILAILTIISGIAVISIQEILIESKKRNLYTEAEKFKSFVGMCRKWKLILPLTSIGIGEKILCIDDNLSASILFNFIHNPAWKYLGHIKHTERKELLFFQCPSRATCTTYTSWQVVDRTTESLPFVQGAIINTKVDYYCLSIQKEQSGKILHVLTIIPFLNPENYEIWCGELSYRNTLDDKICQRGAKNKTSLTKDCPGWY